MRVCGEILFPAVCLDKAKNSHLRRFGCCLIFHLWIRSVPPNCRHSLLVFDVCVCVCVGSFVQFNLHLWVKRIGNAGNTS